ncbi:hypothetical protein J6590_045918 [Homalodisca vitripennis]|nr:hypothetical protein J6590_045918 [Homalodisca vitripennis]
MKAIPIRLGHAATQSTLNFNFVYYTTLSRQNGEINRKGSICRGERFPKFHENAQSECECVTSSPCVVPDRRYGAGLSAWQKLTGDSN